MKLIAVLCGVVGVAAMAMASVCILHDRMTLAWINLGIAAVMGVVMCCNLFVANKRDAG